VFSVPFMVKSASERYGYANDDILIDVIAALGVVFQAIGEIIGALYGGIVADWAGIERTFVIAGGMSVAFGIWFAVGTDLVSDVVCGKKNEIKRPLLERLSPGHRLGEELRHIESTKSSISIVSGQNRD
jgi:hypothetical protein